MCLGKTLNTVTLAQLPAYKYTTFHFRCDLCSDEYGPLLNVVPRAQAKVVPFDKKKFAEKH
jgi:hypothetical protein